MSRCVVRLVGYAPIHVHCTRFFVTFPIGEKEGVGPECPCDVREANAMKVSQIYLRCYVEPSGGQWQAFCVDLDLAAQAESFAEAKEKLDRIINYYVYDALEGEDKAHAESLLCRKAPLRHRMKYRLYAFRDKQRRRAQQSGSALARAAEREPYAFKERIPVHVLAPC